MGWKEEEGEMTGKEIANLIRLRPDEGKRLKESLKALMKAIGAEMPESSKKD